MKNKIKEFFKPTPGKVVLTVIIFFSAIVIYIIANPFLMQECIDHNYKTPACTEYKQFRQTTAYHSINSANNLFQVVFLWPALISANIGGLSFFAVPLSFVWIYFLSCIIVSIYNKFKRRRK